MPDFHLPGQLLKHLSDLGGAAMIVVASLLAIYIAGRAWRRWSVAKSTAKLPRVQPNELAEQIARGDDIIIVDARAAITANGVAPSAF